MPAFVLEIGTEELPARFLPLARKELVERFGSALAEAGLGYADLTGYATPRRQVVFIKDLDSTSERREEVVTGPSLKAAYDVGGRPTRAAEGFAKTHGASLDDVFTLQTEKGEYIALKKVSGGESALEILSRMCPGIILSLPFPKKMRWGDGDISFPRPIRWLLALLGQTTVPFSLGTLQSGNLTHGHRVHGPGPFALQDAEEYFTVIREQGKVICSGQERLELILEKGTALAGEKGASILWKEALLEEVTGLCEFPVPVLGDFDPVYLEVPRQVLLTSMESHQKSFGLEGADGNLLPHFLTVLNMEPRDLPLVRKGWERVLRARLEDARFFWKTDLASGMEPWLNDLDSVIFLAPLGSMGDKTRRISSLCGWLAQNVTSIHGERIDQEKAMRAGRLSKADLVSAMVKEFDTLQGIMGGIYAGRMGEPEEVARAISEQYLPAGPDTPVPGSIYGALVSMADKADTLAGCFGLGMIPTGTADPYALRRAALGIARIALEKGLRFDTGKLFAQALKGYGQREWKLQPDEALSRLEEFFTLRLKNLFISNGADTLLAEACLQADAREIWAASARLSALAGFSASRDFSQSVLTFKRAANILRKQDQGPGMALDGLYDSTLLTDQAEKDLALELERIKPLFDEMWEKEEYTGIFGLLGQLRPFVDAFFEQVMVMSEDKALRKNRLNLLQALVKPLSRLADFSALQI